MPLLAATRSIIPLLSLFLIGKGLASPETNISSIQSVGDPIRPPLITGARYKLAGSTIYYLDVSGAVLPAWYFLGLITGCLLDIFHHRSSTPVQSGTYQCAEHGVLLSITEQDMRIDYGFVWIVLLLLRDTFELYQMGDLRFTVDAPGSSIAAKGWLRFTGDQAGNLSLPTGGQASNVSLAR